MTLPLALSMAITSPAVICNTCVWYVNTLSYVCYATFDHIQGQTLSYVCYATFDHIRDRLWDKRARERRPLFVCQWGARALAVVGALLGRAGQQTKPMQQQLPGQAVLASGAC